jgi:proteasome lid subunit RPN8/RPN11
MACPERRETFLLSSAMAEEIIAHARAGYPDEVCGIIAGRDGVGLALYRGRNISGRPATSYELDVQTLARQIEFEDAGLSLAAIYHSHPKGPETASETDVDRATYPDSVYIICGLADPARPSLRGFRILRGDDPVVGQVREVQIEVAGCPQVRRA